MKISELSLLQRRHVVPVVGHQEVIALVPPALPSSVDLGTSMAQLEAATFMLGTLAPEAADTESFRANLTLLMCREASIGGQSHVVDVSLSDILVERFAPQERAKVSGILRPPINFLNALEYGIALASKQGRAAFSVNTLLRLHELCANGLSDLTPAGRFRTKQTWIRGHRIEMARYVPPPPSYIHRCVEELVEFLGRPERRSDGMPLVVRTALAAAQVKAIQPFSVVGSDLLMRILVPMMAVAEGMPPVFMGHFLHRYSQEALDAQTEQHLTGGWSNWLAFFLDGYPESISEISSNTAALNALKRSWIRMVSETRTDSGVHKVVDALLAQPVFTVQTLQQNLDMSFQTANNAVSALVEKGIVRHLRESRRNRMFIAQSVVDILEREITSDDRKISLTFPLLSRPLRPGISSLWMDEAGGADDAHVARQD